GAGVHDQAGPGVSPGGEGVQLAATDQKGPEAAVGRTVIPPETAERVAAMISPRSSVIISDEGLSSETGRHTDFVVLLSGEPQGGIATRRRSYGGYGRYGGDRYLGSSFRAPVFFHLGGSPGAGFRQRFPGRRGRLAAIDQCAIDQ